MERVEDNQGIAAKWAERCFLCRVAGEELYSSLRDRLFGAPGEWQLKQCPRCRLVWVNPRPVEADIAKLYSNYYTHEDARAPSRLRRSVAKLLLPVKEAYLARTFGYGHVPTPLQHALAMTMYLRPFRREELDAGLMYLSAIPGGRLLDVGCGDGAFLATMESLGWRAEGIDPDPVAVARARERGLVVHLGSLDGQRYPDESFDAVTANHVIEHVVDPVRFLDRCWRLLKPGGRVVVTTPNSESWGRRIFGADWRGWEPPRHLFVFNPAAMSDVSKRTECSNYEISTSSRNAQGIFLASQGVRTTGSYSLNQHQPPLLLLSARLLHLVEMISLRFFPDRGEQLLLLMKKPSC